jgi:hypothetical protein
VFHYLLVTRLPKQPPSDCPPFLFPSPAEYNMSNEIKTKVSPRPTYIRMPGPSTLMVLRMLPRRDLRRITTAKREEMSQGISDESHDHHHVGVHTWGCGLCPKHEIRPQYAHPGKFHVYARDCTGVNGLRMLTTVPGFIETRCQKVRWNAKNIRRNACLG